MRDPLAAIMCNLSNLILSPLLLISCTSEEVTNSDIEKKQESPTLSKSTLDHYEKIYNCELVVGTLSFGICQDENISHYNFIKDSSDLNELWFMLDDTCSSEFKVFLIQEIHQDSPESDSLLVEKFYSDTSTVDFVSSCFGITFTQTLSETCKNIVELNCLAEPIKPELEGLE